MPDINITGNIGTFDPVAAGGDYITAGFGCQLTGTSWKEATYGDLYVLEDASGDAVNEIIKGLTGLNYKGIQSSPWETFDATITGGINTLYPIEPSFKWIYGADTGVFYKVLYVIDDTKIAVEKLTGLGDPGTLYGLGTRGYAAKSVTVSATSGTGKVKGYGASLISIAAGTSVVLPINIDLSGPYIVGGDCTFVLNPISYDGQWQ